MCVVHVSCWRGCEECLSTTIPFILRIETTRVYIMFCGHCCPNPFFYMHSCILIIHALHGCTFWSQFKHLRGACWTQLTASWIGSPFVDICMTYAPPHIWNPQRDLKSFFEAQCYIRGNSRDNTLCVLYLSSLHDLQKYNWATWIYLGSRGRTFVHKFSCLV